MREAKLILDDGSQFCGWSFGYDADTTGEVVFNTAMTGYPESLTDPSYAGQILVTTFPLIGNYGVPDTGLAENGLPLFMESDRIHAKALVVADYSETYSHWNAKESLASWLKREHIPGITGIDTRRLTKVLRENGVMMGRIIIDHSPLTIDHFAAANGTANNGEDPIHNGQCSSDDRLDDIVEYVVGHLSEQDRRIFGLRFTEGYSYEEIAAKEGISKVAVWKHLSHIITSIKKQFNPRSL